MSLFLAVLMCITTLAGFGTTAYAAEETDEIYLVSFPRDGDDNYSGEWGHGNLEFMKGWSTRGSRFTTVYAMGSYTGNICYCIEIGVPVKTGDRFAQKGENFWDNYPSSYAGEVLRQMHDGFVSAYGSDYLEDGSYSFVHIPAVIRSRQSGKLCLGIVTLDLESSGEHWGTEFLTPYGIISQNDPDLDNDMKKYIREQYIPYDYWYTADVENDIHISFDNVPESVSDLIAAARGEEPNMNLGYIKM